MDATSFRVIEYSDIDLDRTKALLKEQGLLLVDLSPSHARTMIALLDEEKKLDDPKFRRRNIASRLFAVAKDLSRLFPLTLASSNLVVLHCIFVNYCKHAEWDELPNGSYRFTFV